ncbi:secretory phospholipase A2 receptor-like [Stylophora pistillata]|uniref:secretory phospholipase A2 receptor-like n=1 Tax=Stylophora pistillata TaxID=50429 RepID=UPI000C046140|nr:secretory phospholipase A2 receptor-like [Stylophora pistillata]
MEEHKQNRVRRVFNRMFFYNLVKEARVNGEAFDTTYCHHYAIIKVHRMQLIMTLFYLPLVAGCRTVKFFKEEGFALQNHVIKTVTDSKSISCDSQCIDTLLCFSINIRRLTNGWVTCELNNSTKTADPQHLILSPGSQYHQIVEVEHCTVDQCIYKDALPDDWYRLGSKLLKLFHDRKTWGQARQFCHSIGGDLLSINQENENEFVSQLLNQIKPNTEGKDVIGHWFLDGTDVDVSLFNGARYEEESTRAGKALYLDGLYAYGTTPAVKFLQSSFTLASWVKLEDLVRSPSTIYGYWKDPHLFRFTANLENKLHFQIKRGLQNLIELSAGSPTIDEWFLAAAVWDETKNEVYLYLNDSKVGNSGGPSNYNPPAYDYEFFDIGLKRDANHTMKGYLRNLMIVNSPLSTEEIFNMRDPNNEAFAGVWIGLNDVTTEGDFHWPDGSHVTYEKWHANEPNNTYKYQDCVQMLISDGTWDDTSCGKRLPFLCEKKH